MSFIYWEEYKLHSSKSVRSQIICGPCSVILRNSADSVLWYFAAYRLLKESIEFIWNRVVQLDVLTPEVEENFDFAVNVELKFITCI